MKALYYGVRQVNHLPCLFKYLRRFIYSFWDESATQVEIGRPLAQGLPGASATVMALGKVVPDHGREGLRLAAVRISRAFYQWRACVGRRPRPAMGGLLKVPSRSLSHEEMLYPCQVQTAAHGKSCS